jgi:hypothetical protein
MAIGTYDELQTAIASWLDRSDLTATIPDFITMFEAVANRRLRVRQMGATTTLIPGNDQYTKILMHFDGDDASTTFTDDNLGGSAHTWTANGDAQIDTAQSVFGGGSVLFDGTGDYLTSPDSLDYEILDGDFAIDCRVRFTATSGVQTILRKGVTTDIEFTFEYAGGSAALRFTSTTDGSTTSSATATWTPALNTWYAVAVTRASGVLRFFVDGEQVGTDATHDDTFYSGTGDIAIGAISNGSNPFKGWIDELRFSVGASRWTADYTPPTAQYVGYGSGSFEIPSDFLQARRVTWSGSPTIELDYVHPSYLYANSPTSAEGTPSIYTIENDELNVRPVSDTPIDLSYWQKVPALSDDNTTNWLLTAHPDLYLFGSLVEAQMFTVDPEQAAIWKARRDEVFDEIASLGRKSQGGGAVRVFGPTP